MTYPCRYCDQVFGGPRSRCDHEIEHQRGSSDDDPTLTAEEMFGTTPPGTPVTPKDHFKPRDYKTAPRFRYRSDGRPYPKIEPRETLETELPLDQCSDGESFRPRRRD